LAVRADALRMTNTKRILIVVTSHDRLGDTGEKTGIWLEELSTPYWVLSDAGFELDIASTRGGKAPLDPKTARSATWSTRSPSPRRSAGAIPR
jgi:putative intracellular protease/amidase